VDSSRFFDRLADDAHFMHLLFARYAQGSNGAQALRHGSKQTYPQTALFS
jgi:hypothetical protein